MNNRGFSLTELVVVIAIMATLLAVVSINFSSWQKKYAIEAQVKEMLVDLTDVRSLAIQTKKEHRIFMNPKSYTFRRYSSEADPKTITGGVQVFSKSLTYEIQKIKNDGTYEAFNNTTTVIDSRGLTTSLFTIAVGAGVSDPAYNCLTMHYSRVNMGKINESTKECEFK